MTFSPLDVFKAHFLFLFSYLRFVLLLGCVFVLLVLLVLLVLWCVQNIYVKKNKEFKTALMTSFTLLLTGSRSGLKILDQCSKNVEAKCQKGLRANSYFWGSCKEKTGRPIPSS